MSKDRILVRFRRNSGTTPCDRAGRSTVYTRCSVCSGVRGAAGWTIPTRKVAGPESTVCVDRRLSGTGDPVSQRAVLFEPGYQLRRRPLLPPRQVLGGKGAAWMLSRYRQSDS